MYSPGLSSIIFSIVACLIIFAATVRKSRVVDLLGDVLSPLLVVSLFVIMIKGMLSHPAAPAHVGSVSSMLLFGLQQGYNTMDLLGTFFFSGVIVSGLKLSFASERNNKKRMALYALQASVIGATLLGLVYVGFGLVASYYAGALIGTSPEILLGTLAHMILGKAGGFVVSMAVALACLTTAITLAVVFAEFLQEQVLGERVSYATCLAGTLLIAGINANFGFSQIVAMMVPVLAIIYPALIVMTIAVILQKTHGVRHVKFPVFATAGVSLLWYHLPTAVKVANTFIAS